MRRKLRTVEVLQDSLKQGDISLARLHDLLTLAFDCKVVRPARIINGTAEPSLTRQTMLRVSSNTSGLMSWKPISTKPMAAVHGKQHLLFSGFYSGDRATRKRAGKLPGATLNLAT